MNNVEIGLVLLIGLPASGKTTFSDLLKRSLENSSNISGMRHNPSCFVINVSYDKLIPWHTQMEEASVTWSEERKNVLSLVEKLITCLKTGRINESELSVLVDFSEYQKYHDRTVIIIDDNMYYRSMRYQYFQLARLYSLGFSQVYIHCDLNEVLQRNAIRKIKDFVPDEVIKRMAINLETPDKTLYTWEQYSCSISSLKPINSVVLCDVTDVIFKSMQDPVTPICHHSAEAEIARKTCLASVIHQVDLTLRKIIGQKLRKQQKTLDKEQMKQIAKDLQIKKQMILKQVSDGIIMIPEEISSSIESCSSNSNLLLCQFLEYQF